MKMISRLAAMLAFSVMTACAPMAAEQARAPAPMPVAAEARKPVTILISIDGFRPDYLRRGVTPNIDALAKSGVESAMRPSFPSKTFPNHWAIVTGKRPDHSGITANLMEDAARPGETFTMASDDPFWWNGAEPIWVTAEKAGVRSATMFWPGANVAWGGNRATAWPYTLTGGTRPSDWQQFNQAVSDRQRVDAVIDWLRRPADNRPQLLTLYFDLVDTAGHQYGPDAQQTTDAVAEVDGSIGRLVAGLGALGQTANIVIVSDHGMAATSSERTIPLDKIAPLADYRVVESGPYASFIPASGREAAFEKAFLKTSHDHMQCWKKGEIPARFHYGTNARIPPYFCLAETGWSIVPTAPAKAFVGGNHGYDNAAADMAALFVASGPGFRAGSKLPASFDNVDVYPMLARLIGIQPVSGDGDPVALAGLLAGQ